MQVWLLTTGDSSDGNEWYVQAIYATHALAVAAQVEYQRELTRPDGTKYQRECAVEKWTVIGAVPDSKKTGSDE